MKRYNFIIPAFLLLIWAGFSGCEKKKEPEKGPQFEIYENHDISACGVDDPLRNLDWLAEFTAKYKNPISYEDIHNDVYLSYGCRIELYVNVETQEEHLVFFSGRDW